MITAISNFGDLPFRERYGRGRIEGRAKRTASTGPPAIEIGVKRSFTFHLLLFAAFFLAFTVRGIAQTGESLIHLGDLIDVDVAGSLEYDWRGGLTPEGFLDGLEQTGEQIFARCRTESDVAADITRELSKVLRDPHVTVRIIDRSGRAAVTLDGAVRMPHRFQLRRTVRLSELLAYSGGITDRSSGDIRLFRPPHVSCSGAETADDGQPRTSVIKIADILAGNPEADPAIVAGDVITVTEAPPVYVIGGVATAISLPLRDGMTISRAIAGAGGIGRSGIAESITIYRRTGGRAERIKADLKKIKAGAEDDILLKPYDVVDVEEKGRGARTVVPEVEPPTRNSVRLPLKIIE